MFSTYIGLMISIILLGFLYILDRKKTNFGVKVLVAMALGIAFGTFFKEKSLIIEPIGKIFISLIKMVVIPMIMTALISSVTSLKSTEQLKKIGLKTIGLLLFTTAIAAVIGIFVGVSMDLGSGVELVKNTSFKASELPTFSKTLLDMIPSNPISSMAEGKLIPVIVFSIFIAVAIIVEGSKRPEVVKPVKDSINSFAEIMFSITKMVIRLAPYGVFSLMTTVAAKNGAAALIPLAKLIVAMYVASLLHIVFTYGTLLTFVAKVNPFRFFKKIYPAQIVAFTTQSSYGTLPVTLKALTDRVKISEKIASFAAPIGTNVGMNGGGGLYPALVAIFVARAYNIELSMSHYLLLVFTTVIGSIGIAGVPGAATIAATVALTNLGLPVEGLAVVLGVDAVIDMVRTMLNVTGSSVTAFLVANSENEFDRDGFNNNEDKEVKLKAA